MQIRISNNRHPLASEVYLKAEVKRCDLCKPDQRILNLKTYKTRSELFRCGLVPLINFQQAVCEGQRQCVCFYHSLPPTPPSHPPNTLVSIVSLIDEGEKVGPLSIGSNQN